MKKQAPVVAVRAFTVKDYTAWRKVFEAQSDFRQQGGMIEAEILRCPKNANKVLVIQRYESVEKMEAFFGNPELREAMAKSGVVEMLHTIVGVAA